MSSVTDSGNSGGAVAGLLAGLRVIDLSRNLPGPFCTRMLADLGATITKVEPPEGDPSRPLGPLFDALNHGKECRRIDFKQAADPDRRPCAVRARRAPCTSRRSPPRS